MNSNRRIHYVRPELLSKAAAALVLGVKESEFGTVARDPTFPRATTAHGGIPMWDKHELEAWRALGWLRRA